MPGTQIGTFLVHKKSIIFLLRVENTQLPIVIYVQCSLVAASTSQVRETLLGIKVLFIFNVNLQCTGHIASVFRLYTMLKWTMSPFWLHCHTNSPAPIYTDIMPYTSILNNSLDTCVQCISKTVKGIRISGNIPCLSKFTHLNMWQGGLGFG